MTTPTKTKAQLRLEVKTQVDKDFNTRRLTSIVEKQTEKCMDLYSNYGDILEEALEDPKKLELAYALYAQYKDARVTLEALKTEQGKK